MRTPMAYRCQIYIHRGSLAEAADGVVHFPSALLFYFTRALFLMLAGLNFGCFYQGRWLF